MPAERGISQLAGMQILDIPPPTKNLEKDYALRVDKLLSVLDNHDCFYIHLKGPDEPGHDGNFNLKRQMIATTDKYFIGKLLQKINLKNHVICVTADHATPCELKAHSDDPVPLLISGNNVEADKVQCFSEQSCRNGNLGLLCRGTELLPKLVTFLI
jgi:2,3-bisphosphoglycerate-independent phosphoglycerate mutase